MTQSKGSVAIRHWRQADVPYVAESVKREGWGHTRRDVERCWNLEPNGSFIAESENQPVGHVFSVLYGKIGWIGLLIVNPDKRGMGVGEALMKAAINYLEDKGAKTIKLEAVEKAAPLYRRLGFNDEFDSLRFRGVSEIEKNQLCNEGVASRMREDDVLNVARFDAGFFGGNRFSVLKSLHEDNPQYCFVVQEMRRVVGYLMARKTLNGLWVGPWMCNDPEIAQTLYCALCAATHEEAAELRLGLPALNIEGRALVENSGFQLTGKSIHMMLGNMRNRGSVSHIYGIGGPEKG